MLDGESSIQLDRHIRVQVLGRFRILDSYGNEVGLSVQRRAVLAVLVTADGPIAREELIAAVGISRQTLSSLLTRMSGRLGLPRRVHKTVDGHSSKLELDRDVVHSDLADLRDVLASTRPDSERLIELLGPRAPASTPDLGLKPDHPLAKEIDRRIGSLVAKAVGLIAWKEISRPSGAPSMLEGRIVLPQHWPATYLVRLDAIARTDGPEAAMAEYERLPRSDSRDGTIPFGLLAPVIIHTASDDSRTKRRSTLQDRRRANLIANGLDRKEVRVLFVHDPQVDSSSIAGLTRTLRKQSTAVFGGWAQADRSALQQIVDIMHSLIRERVRSSELALTPRLLSTLGDIYRGTTLGLDSNPGQFSRDLSALLADDGEGERPLLIVGRTSACADDPDRALGHLLRLNERLRLVVFHADSGSPGLPSVLEEFPVQRMSSRIVDNGVDSDERDQSHSNPPPLDLGAAELERLLVVVSFAVDDEGRVARWLADALLDRVGANVDFHDVARTVDEAIIDQDERLVVSPDGLPGWAEMSAGDQIWLLTEAINRIVDHGSPSGLELAVLARLARNKARPPGLSQWLIDRATQTISLGDLTRALSILEVAIDTADSDKSLAVALTKRGDCHRELGRWSSALADYRQAVSKLGPAPGSARDQAELALRMARLTWDPDIGVEVEPLLHAARANLGQEEAVLRARIDLCLAGGLFQDGVSISERQSSEELCDALDVTRRSFDPTARAWGVVHLRKALLGVAPVTQSSQWAKEILDDAGADSDLEAHGMQAVFVDSVRGGDWHAAEQALGIVEKMAITAVSAEQRFSARVARTCWELAQGNFQEAEYGRLEELRYRGLLGESTFNQVTAAHGIWLALHRDDPDELAGLAELASDMANSQPGGSIWTAGASLLSLAAGDVQAAALRILEFARRAGGFTELPAGAHRIGVLSIAALISASAATELGGGSPFRLSEVKEIARGLQSDDHTIVLIGWPTVILGPLDRFLGLALAASGRHHNAAAALTKAGDVDRPMLALHQQTAAAQALARTLSRR